MLLALALLSIVPVAAQEPADAPPVLRGRCVLAHGAAGALADDPEGAAELLEHHARCHGWRLGWDGADWVAPERAVRCPEDVLNAMRAVYAADRELRHPVALALERNGHIDEVLAQLAEDASLGGDGPTHDHHPLRRARAAFRPTLTSGPSELGARIALRHGRPARALEFAGTWHVDTGCGNCTEGRLHARKRVEALAYAALGHDDELRRLALERDLIHERFRAGVVAVWIDREVSRYPGLPLDVLIAKRIVPYTGEADRTVAYALASRRAVAQPVPAEQFERFAMLHGEAAAAHLLSLGGSARAALLEATEKRPSVYSATVSLFVEIGLPELGPWFESAPDPSHFGVKFTRERWEPAHRAWRVLVQP